jgi:dTDP-4-amino-4,6-dideoxygalactose transaminase
MIPYGRQEVTESDIRAVTKVLHSNFLTQGSAIPIFEKKLCDYTGAKYAVAVNTAELSNIAINNSIFLNPSNWRV